MSTINSPNMNLPVPVAGSEPGPDYATDINNSLNIIDAHTHVSGSGVPITPSAINVNTDLTMANNSLTNTKAVAFTAQASPSSTNGALSESGVDLYYTDGNGNQVRLTQSGSIAGSPGSISGLSSPASASYSSGAQTFTWQSGANVPANLDAGAVVFRNLTSNSKGVTVSPVAGLGSNYSLVLPTLPASSKLLTLDNSGNISAVTDVDNSTLQITSNTIAVKANGITASQIANNTITATQVANATLTTTQLSASAGITAGQLAGSIPITKLATATTTSGFLSGSYTNSTGTFSNIASVTFTATAGRPIFINFIGSGPGYIAATGSSDCRAEFRLVSGGGLTVLTDVQVGGTPGGTTYVPPGAMNYIDFASGSVTYQLQGRAVGVSSALANGIIMQVFQV